MIRNYDAPLRRFHVPSDSDTPAVWRLSCCCSHLSAFAQGGTATINGTVFDQAKAVLPGVTVTITNEATGITREAVTGAEGQFVVPTLLAGDLHGPR